MFIVYYGHLSWCLLYHVHICNILKTSNIFVNRGFLGGECFFFPILIMSGFCIIVWPSWFEPAWWRHAASRSPIMQRAWGFDPVGFMRSVRALDAMRWRDTTVEPSSPNWTHTPFLKPTITSETCGSATSQSSREVCEFLQSIKPLNPEDFSPVGRFAPSRQWQRPPQPRSRWETGCCRPSIARAMWVTRSLSCRPKLTFPDTTQLEPYFAPHRASECVAGQMCSSR